MTVGTPAETMIPLQPCANFAQTIEFYETLGFTVTHQQEEPYVYIAVSKGALDLHFSGSLGVYGAKNAFGSCLLFVDEVALYHRTFADSLRRTYGRVPTAALPRITRLRTGDTRFKLFDPSGNMLIFINRNEPEVNYYEEADALQSALEQALSNAEFLRDTYSNDKAAARVLDLALERNSTAAPLARARVLAARAELAVAMEDTERAQVLRHELQQMNLSADERTQFAEELQAADVLERWLVQEVPGMR